MIEVLLDVDSGIELYTELVGGCVSIYVTRVEALNLLEDLQEVLEIEKK
jgi:hypothetical protein